MKRTLFLAAALAWGAGDCNAQQPAAAPVAITHAAVIDVESGRTLRDQTVVVRGSRIESVGPAARVAVPTGARVVDGRGKFVIPGMWDMHVHAAFPQFEGLFMPLLAVNGITGAREMFSRIDWVESTRARIGRGELVGPRIVGSGHIIDGSPPMLGGTVVARDAAEGRHAVDSLAAAGADFIKVYSRLTPDAFAGIADEAKRRGIPFAGHVPSLVTVDEASAAGMASIEHMTGVVNACSPLPPAQAGLVAEAVAQKGWEASYAVSQSLDSLVYARYDPAVCRALARRLAQRGTVVVPTLVTLHAASFLDDTTFAHDPRLRYTPRGMSTGWSPLTNPRLRTVSAADWANSHRQYNRLLEAARVLHENGVRFMAGTDLITPYTFAGFSLHEELERLVGIGFTPLQALQSATIEPARFLKMTDSLGTVARGKVADLVVLDADPLADIRNVGGIHAVVLNGRLIDAAERERILRAAEARAAQPPAP